jgi:uncharacterized membrane protein YbhN (UPF0104 family)
MGELDLLKVCGVPDPFTTGTQYAMRTVFLTWLPFVLAGIALRRTRGVHATMRGAGPLRLLAHLAIAVQVGAVAFPLLLLVGLVSTSWTDRAWWVELFPVVAIGVCIVLPIAAISVVGIVAWHRVLVALASREGEGRMLV